MGVIALDAGLIKILFNYILCLIVCIIEFVVFETDKYVYGVWCLLVCIIEILAVLVCIVMYVVLKLGIMSYSHVLRLFFFVFVFYGKVRNLYYTLWKFLDCCVYAWRWFLVLKNLFYSVWCSVICTNDWDLYLNYLLNYNYYEN